MKTYKAKTLKGHGFEIELDSSAFYEPEKPPVALTEKERLEKAEHDAKINDEIMYHSAN